MNFNEFRDDYRVFRAIDRKNRATTAEQFIRHMESSAIGRMDAFNTRNFRARCAAQLAFYKWGKPYVKVWPEIAWQLAHTKVNIDGALIKPAYPSFEIRLPVDPNPFTEHGETLKSILCFFAERYVHLYLDFGWKHEEVPFGIYYECEFEIAPGLLIAQSVEEMPYIDTGKEQYRRPSREFIRSVVSLAISTNFFLTGEHELVAPDIQRKHRDRYLAAKARCDEKEIELIIESAKRDGLGGFTLGHEINLPRDVVHYHKEPSGEPEKSWELRFSHVRSGHLRMQPVGPREAGEKKLIFVMPAVIRPDLPLRPRVGYRIEG